MMPFLLLLLFSMMALAASRHLTAHHSNDTKPNHVTTSVPMAQSDTEEGVYEIINRMNKGFKNRKPTKTVTETLIDGDILVQNNAAACTSSYCKWPKDGDYVTIDYKISRAFSRAQIRLIQNVLTTLEARTCIRFRRHHKKRGSPDFIHIISDTGCWSFVGRIGAGEQFLSLQQNGCMIRRIVEHELLHALGFQHEHVRSDRDDYIEILEENILEGMEGNFVKRDTNNLQSDYNLKSVMHYDRLAFSKNGLDTIRAKSGATDFGFYDMGDEDFARVNKLYGCSQFLP